MINFFLYHTFGFIAAAALLCAGLTGITLAVLRRRAILDMPNERSSHTVPTPRGGGWGVMLALLPFWVWAVWKAGRVDQPAELALLASAVLLMAIWIAIGFVFRGVATTVSAISDPTLPGRGWNVFTGIVSLLAGVIVLAWPLSSMQTLALLAGASLIVIGVMEVASAFAIRRATKQLASAPAP